MQIADKYYLNYLAKFIADNRYYRDNFEKIIDYRDKKYCTDNDNPSTNCTVYNLGTFGKLAVKLHAKMVDTSKFLCRFS